MSGNCTESSQGCPRYLVAMETTRQAGHHIPKDRGQLPHQRPHCLGAGWCSERHYQVRSSLPPRQSPQGQTEGEEPP